VYGDFHYPNELGSGSGTYNGGGSGGGLVQITTATAQVDGTILANGGNSYDGGSGGGILLTVGTLSGSGQISANGGNGAGNDGGGGGRVAIYYGANTFDLSNNVTANGGAANSSGSVGTVYLQQTGSLGQLVIDNHGTPVGQWTPLGVATNTAFLVDNLLVAGTNVIVKPEHQMPVLAGSISITNGAEMTHQPTTTSQPYSLLLTVTNNLLVDGTSTINVSACGYLPGYTLGNTTNGAANNTAGGSYGGLGGICCSSTGNAVYGDYHNPDELGSGSGPYNNGASGGGLVQITAGTARVDGTILANGGNGYDGGSGGGILLNIGTLSGAGQINANGGAASADDGGGGGRVAIYYGANTFNLSNNATASGGQGSASSGSAGTVYLQQTGALGQLVINNYGTANGQWTPLGQTNDVVFTADALVLSGSGTMAATISGAPIQAGSVSLVNGAVLTHQPTTAAQAYSLLLTVTNNLLVDAASSINVSERGYLPGYTLGGTNVGGANNTAGGSYGGLGGLCCGSTSDAVYGDFRNPNELGSGSGNYNGGGPGGGLVQITAATAQVDGTILANGGNSYDGGSGGGILLTVGTLSGAGQISANGGAGNGDDGGGGGRVAIYYGTNTFDLSNNVAANGGAANSSGSVGTVYLQQTGSLGQLVIDNHGTPAGQWTPLGQATDVVVQVGSLVISGTNVVAAPEHQMSIEADFISITNGADLTHQVTTATQTYSLVLAATNTLLVDGTSTINVSGRGYLPGYTLGNTTNGAANNTAGGSYGGLGGLCCNSTTDPVYGSLYDPNNLGSGSGTYNGGGSGGGLVQITAGTAQVDGAILADGENAYDGGSGGGILMNVGTLIGAGQINANGGTASGNDGGGGGRVAIYTWTAMLMPSGNILANGGHGGSQSGQNGSDFVTTQPYIAFLNVLQYWHGIEQIAWSTMGVNPNGGDTAEILISKAGVTYFSQSVPASASLTWNTATVPDDNYTLSVKLLNAAGQTVGQISQNELINNSLAWHEGTLSTSQTWGTNAVNAVDQTVIIPSGVTLTIAPGAIVKFAPGAGIIIEAGGVLNASGSTFNAPIVFTSLADSSVGGDSDKDGDASVPLSGDWSGITGPGQFETSASVQVRYVIQTVSGTLTANQEWLGSAEYIIGGNITVPTNVTLTIDPGAIIKFELGYNLTVNSGGTLIANGTVAQPIVFTSINDESVGADTNTVITTPEAGDWDSIYLNGGQATLDHVSISYGGGPNSLNSALISIIAPGSVVSVSDSILNQGFYRGIEAEYGTANVTNCLVTGCQRGIQSGLSGPTVVNIINCTVDNNGIGIIGHGGVMNVANTIVSDSLQNGVYYCCGSSLALFEYCDVWSATGVNYTGAADQTGVNGNISANPDFVNAAQGNYELNYGSPCIDSADGAVGPLTDLLGAPGYNYPGLAVKTGIANADGIYPDMGAYEFSENAPSDVDLIVTSVIGPVQESAGQTVNVQWNDVNIGSGSAVGPWYDTLSLVSQNGSNTLAVATILVAQGLVLGPGQTYPASTTVEVPGGLDGPYQWQVQVNSKGDVFEGANSTNNTTLAAAPTTLTVPNLADGTVATNDLPGVGDYVWYSFVAPSNGDFQVTLDRTGGTAGISMYIGQGYVPNLQNFDVVAAGGASATLSALISDASSQPYYIAVYAASGAGTGFFTLDTGALNLALNSVTPSTLGNAGPATLTISGGELTSQMTYQVVDPHGGVHNATSVTVANPSLVYATFDFTGLPLGAYGLQINGGALTLHDALTLTGIPPGNLVLNITGPSLERPGRSSTLVVTYTNTGGGNMASPILFLDSDNGKFRLPGESVWVASQFQILAINTDGGPAGVLPPGYGGQIQVEFAQQTLSVGGTSHYTVSLADPNTNVNWAVLEQSIEPQLQPDASWGVIFTNFQAKVGNTYGQLQSALAQDATYLGQSGKLVADVLGLLTYEFEQGDNFGTITKRYHAGAFGLGMADPTDVSASSGSGEVVVQSSGLVRVFTIQPNGTYVGQPGDFGTVTETGGAVQLREKNGNITSFHSNGTLAYYQDPNGDRTNANYTGSLLTGFTDSFGNTISYTYNAGGHISQVTDPVGRVTTYTYDAPGQHVVQISNYLGAVGLSWITNQGAAQNNALASVTNPDGTHLYYQYDQNGRLTNQFRDGGAQSLSYTYASTGQVILADASGASITVSPDDSFKLGTYQNSLGIATVAGYDTNLDVTSLKNSAGQSITSDYDTNGNVVSSVDPLGYQLGSTYDPAFSKPTSVSDALGNQVTAQYDAHGNMLSETYPTGASDSYQYDSAGNVVARTNRRGHTTLFAYNAYNLVTNKTLPDNSMQTYTYDGHRNLISITDATGTTTYAYDAADRMTNVTYPNGHFLQFSYGAGNRRTQMVDQDGFTVNYSYDSVGRLAMLSDALDNAIVKYTYDAVGRVASKTFANGSVTTNVYSSNALLKSIVNLAANGTVLSSFDYAYDTLGRITNMTTPNGTFSYNYDEDNQLTSVNLSGGRGIQYQYDGNGNRTAVTDSGTNTTYLGNALNQYATIGAATFTYDADGNLISEADATGTNTYAYDDQNELVSFTSPAGIWTYQYNAVGQRVAMTQNGQTTDYVLDPFGLGNIVGEYQSGGALTAHYTYGLELASRVDSSGSAAYYTFDASGNTSGLIGQAGNLTDSYSYLPFGEKLVATGTTSNPFTFAGKVGVMDDGSGVYSMRARFYDPSQGRFLSTDPGHVLSPNLYNYGNNNPLAFVDATGSDPTSEANGANNLNNALNLGANINNAVNNGLNGPGTPSDTTSTVTGVAGEAATGGGSTVATAGGVATTAVGGTQAVVFGGLSQLADNNTLNAEFNLPELGGNGGKPPSGGPPGGGVPGGGNNPSGGQTSYPGPSDPNDKVTSGFGTEGYVTETGSIYYTIDFANETNAATPAAEVVVTDQLDTNLNWSTFTFQTIAFNNVSLSVPNNVQSFAATSQVSTDPNPVHVTATFNPATGVATWVMESIDPVTQSIPANPLAGFLPPDNALHQGEGYLTYSVETKAGLTAGTQITNQAVIVFDVNPPIATGITTNAVDAAPPVSSMTPLPALSALTFTVSWSGSDAGPGIAGFDIYVSTNSGPWTPWLVGTTNTSAPFSGINSNSYAFYSVAYDQSGLVQPNPTIPGATTVASSTVPPSEVLNIVRSAPTSLTLTWAQGALLQATKLDGPWTTNTSTSPYTVAATNSQMYFKVLEN
jgi:RHS repeat-associated protein